MKLKIGVIILSVVLLLFIAYGVVATMAVVETRNEWSVKYDELATKHSELTTDYKELSTKYTESISNEISEKTDDVLIQSVVSVIDDNASYSIHNDSVVNITVPKSNDVKNKVSENISFLKMVLNQREYKSCVISVIDDDGKCSYGWTILSNGESFVFISE